MRNVLIVSPYFPPSTLAGVHRARHLVRHLPATGWRPTVICVDERHHEQTLDPGLAALVPADARIVKTEAFSKHIARRLGLGEISLRAWRPLKQAIFSELSRRRFDAVLITGSPFYPMLMAPGIRRRHQVPVVLDFQDPWVSAWGATQRPLSKAGASHRLAEWLEPRALKAANFVTSVSDTQNAEMAARYPWLDEQRMCAIPIGGDLEDFVALRESPPPGADADLGSGVINLSYVGTFMPRTVEVMRALLQGFRLLKERHPEIASRIRLNFIGTSNQPTEGAKPLVMPLAEEEGVADHVRETPHRLPYLRALGVLARSDGLLLMGSDEPHYTASKIYPALMSGTPYLSVFHQDSSAHHILQAARGGSALSFDSPKILSSLAPDICDGLLRLATKPQSFQAARSDAFAPFEAAAIARSFADVFEKAGAA